MLQRFVIASGLLSAAWALNGCGGESCTVINNADGTATLRCDDGTSATIANGMDGTDGMNGMNGMDGMDGMNGMDGTAGTSCTVTDNGDGTKTISCTDGTMVIVSDGADGMDGVPGMDGSDAPVTVLFAVVTSTGTISRGFGTTASMRLGAGTYEVVFDRDVTGCSYVATVGNPDLGVTDGTVDLAPRFGVAAGVYVQTRDLAGTIADRNFHLQVACPTPMP